MEMNIPKHEEGQVNKDRAVYEFPGRIFKAWSEEKNTFFVVTEDAAMKAQSKINKREADAAKVEAELAEMTAKEAEIEEEYSAIMREIAEDKNAAFNSRFTRTILNAKPNLEHVKTYKNGAKNFSITYLRDKLDQIFSGETSVNFKLSEQIDSSKDGGKRKSEVYAICHLSVTYPVTGFVRTVVGTATAAPGTSHRETFTLSTAQILNSKAEKAAIQALGKVFGRGMHSDEDDNSLYDIPTDSSVNEAKSM